MKKISYFPFRLVDNNYTENFKAILSKVAKTEIDSLNFKEILIDVLKFRFRKRNIVFVNWMENELIKKNGKISLIGVLKVFVKIFILKLTYQQIIYVRHNLYPHNTRKSHINLVTKLTTSLANMADIRISHSPIFKDKMSETFYIPHPLYKLSLDEKRKDCLHDYFVVFGNIARYKKIEELIKVFPKNRELFIFGGCKDETYLDSLKKLTIDKKNIKISARFYSDLEAASIIKSSNGMIICHAEDDMIVSGSFFYGLSCKVKLLVIETPFLKWSASQLGKNVIETFSNINVLSEKIEKEKFEPNCYNKTDDDIIDKLFSDKTIEFYLEKII